MYCVVIFLPMEKESLTCGASDKVLGLYTTTNSHAEIPTQNYYPVNVSYLGVKCISTIIVLAPLLI